MTCMKERRRHNMFKSSPLFCHVIWKQCDLCHEFKTFGTLNSENSKLEYQTLEAWIYFICRKGAKLLKRSDLFLGIWTRLVSREIKFWRWWIQIREYREERIMNWEHVHGRPNVPKTLWSNIFPCQIELFSQSSVQFIISTSLNNV